jgi:sensor histidine kinase YesM
MKKDETIKRNLIAMDEKNRMKRFWLVSFAVYAMIDGGYSILNYFITSSMCSDCLLPVPFYISQWLLSLLFTGLLWYSLNLFYNKSGWMQVPVNIVLFALYYTGAVWLLYSIFHSGQDWLIGAKTYIPNFDDIIHGSWFDIGKYVLKASAFYVLKYYVEYRHSERQRTELAVINKDMQLNLLKQQLSPHFYFNTLNNLYGLARSNSAKLPDALSQLSNIMQYVIVDCNQPKVLLSEEVSFLQSYIALEKLRYEQNTVIDMQVEGQANGQSILPLMLIQFVENAFKHGMKEKSEQNWMKVNMQIDKDKLLFSVDNSYYETDASKGIGIASVQHRLDLQYEGKYDMQMQHAGNRFSVVLRLDLS